MFRISALRILAVLMITNMSFLIKKVTDYLLNTKYSFLYYCRSNPLKLDNIFNKADAEHNMKIKLAQHFMNKGYYFQKVRLNKDTELMVSNCQYDTEIQFRWMDIEENII